MLAFFRRLRRKVFGRAGMRKYFFYAAGEIFLVVIGILIALQINNWNEHKKEVATGKDYLRRIKSDLVKDTMNLSAKSVAGLSEQSTYEAFIENLYVEQADVEEFAELISSVVWRADNLVLEDKSYTEITNSGKFSYVEDEAVRNMIMDYYRKYKEVDKHIMEMNETGITLMSKSYKRYVKYYDVIRHLFEKDNIEEVHDWAYVNDPSSTEFKELESSAVFYYYKQEVFGNYYRELKADATRLLKTIDLVLA